MGYFSSLLGVMHVRLRDKRTFAAFDLHLRAGLRAAMFHRRQCPSVLRPETGPVVRQEVGLEGFDALAFIQSKSAN